MRDLNVAGTGRLHPLMCIADGEFMINISTSLSDSAGLVVNSMPIEKESIPENRDRSSPAFPISVIGNFSLFRHARGFFIGYPS